MESSLTLPAKIVDLSDIFVIFDLETVREDAIFFININNNTNNNKWVNY